MTLHFKQLGMGYPLIILHGLYGSSDNWMTVAKALAAYFEVFVVDQRNHGLSPHHPEHNYDVLQNDLLEFMQSQSIEKAILLGHSMGGKTAMLFALLHPQLVSRLIVVDISPRSYMEESPESAQLQNHNCIIDALTTIDLSKVSLRDEVDKQLAKTIHDVDLRRFLLKNLQRKTSQSMVGEPCFVWRINIAALKANMPAIMSGFDNRTFAAHEIQFPTLFVRGQLSPYISDADRPIIDHLFPDNKIVTIANAGHWVHGEQTNRFMDAVINFVVN